MHERVRAHGCRSPARRTGAGKHACARRRREEEARSHVRARECHLGVLVEHHAERVAQRVVFVVHDKGRVELCAQRARAATRVSYGPRATGGPRSAARVRQARPSCAGKRCAVPYPHGPACCRSWGTAQPARRPARRAARARSAPVDSGVVSRRTSASSRSRPAMPCAAARRARGARAPARSGARGRSPSRVPRRSSRPAPSPPLPRRRTAASLPGPNEFV